VGLLLSVVLAKMATMALTEPQDLREQLEVLVPMLFVGFGMTTVRNMEGMEVGALTAQVGDLGELVAMDNRLSSK
jgi:hypothetical protein